jgi:hypothetical protein
MERGEREERKGKKGERRGERGGERAVLVQAHTALLFLHV